jgi:hypothetical protein
VCRPDHITQAVEGGSKKAYFNLGVAHQRGAGVEGGIDLDAAGRWFELDGSSDVSCSFCGRIVTARGCSVGFAPVTGIEIQHYPKHSSRVFPSLDSCHDELCHNTEGMLAVS